MSRVTLLVLSVVDCGFGLMAIFGSGSTRSVGLLLNFVLAVGLAFWTTRDLRERGQHHAWVFGLLYILAPLFGLIVYAALSDTPKGVSASA